MLNKIYFFLTKQQQHKLKQKYLTKNIYRTKGLFLESPDNFSTPKSCFVFLFKMKVPIILKMM